MINLSEFSIFFIANWKLNGNLSFIKEYTQLLKVNSSKGNCVVICPTAIYLNNFKQNEGNYYLGAQDISKYEAGAFTGEISSKSLTEFGVNFCIVGHSERRQYFNEKNEDVKEKAAKLLEAKRLEEARLAQMNPRQRWAAQQDYIPQAVQHLHGKRGATSGVLKVGGAVHSRGRRVPGMYHGK